MKTNLFFRRSGHFRVVLRVCLTLSAVFCLAACGQKGPLYLPKSAPTPDATQSQATPSKVTQSPKKATAQNVAPKTPSQSNNASTSP